MNNVRPFYSPISAGSMAHTGPMPQSNVQYHTVTPHVSGVITKRLVSTGPSTVLGPRGLMPPSLHPVIHPTGNNFAPGYGNVHSSRMPNFFNPPQG
jgi:hypothetical protein